MKSLNLWSLFELSFRKEFRNKYPRALSWFGQLTSELGLLSVYWFTAQAFVPNLHLLNPQMDYFSFIVIGEVTLFVPCILLTAFSRVFRSEVQQGTLDISLLSKSPLLVSWSAQVFGLLAAESFRLLLIFIFAFTLFGFRFLPAPNLALILCLQLAAWPFFAGVGMIGASVILVWGRGERLLPLLTTAMTVLAGAYFPPEVLPVFLQPWLAQLSPMNLLLQSTRSLAQVELAQAEKASTFSPSILYPNLNSNFLFLLFFSFIFLTLGICTLHWSVRRYRHRSQPLLFLT